MVVESILVGVVTALPIDSLFFEEGVKILDPRIHHLPLLFGVRVVSFAVKLDTS